MMVIDPTVPRFAEGRWITWLDACNAPRDGAGLGAFRALFGALLALSVIRFWAYGWIDELYVRPSFHFTFFGFDWVRPWPGSGMYLHFGVMTLAAVSLCVGCFSRTSAALFCLTFTYAELIEKASYLNHYYFVSLVTLLLATMPCGASLSVDALRRRRRGLPPLVARAWCYGLLRAQLALLYFFAGLAKLNADWLLSAQPLGTWLALHADAPWIGPWLASRPAAYLASYAGAAFDLTIPLWLWWRRTRPYAYGVAVAFHVVVWLLFPIGVFSWVMIVATTAFFDPTWPRRWLDTGNSRHATAGASPPSPPPSDTGRLARPSLALLAAYLLVQLSLPLRHVLYPGNVNWHEQGFRFAWRVMLVEKAGQVEFRVVTGADDQRFVVYPRETLTPLQYKMMTTQPDMILEFAHYLRQRFVGEGHERVRVYADAWASLNGRPRQRLIDPAVDLGSEPWTLWPKPWILPLQNSS
jgi:vitamin K-dependent gamma-carboxylase